MVGWIGWIGSNIQIYKKRVIHSDTHRERSESERRQSERSHHNRIHSERSQSGRTLCPAHEGRPLQAWRMCMCV